MDATPKLAIERVHELDTNEYQYEMNKFLVQSILESILEDFHFSDLPLDAYFQHESLYYGTADVYPGCSTLRGQPDA